MFSIQRINHVAIVVDDLDEALNFWRDALQLDVTHVEDIPEQEALVAFLPAAESEIELVKPTSQTSGVARFLDRRGPGMHHICLEVDDIEACLAHLIECNVKLINPEPILGTGGMRIAFIHPESTHGVLVELYELSPQEEEIRLVRSREFAKRIRNQGQIVAEGLRGFLRRLRENGTLTEKD